MRNTMRRRGFTLVELLVVVSILALLSGMVVGLFSSATEKAGATVSMATQKQLLNQTNSYMQLHDSQLADGFDSLLKYGYTGTFTTLGTYAMVGQGNITLGVAGTPADFFAQNLLVGQTATTDPKNINRGVDEGLYKGQNRVLTVKQITLDDYQLLTSLGLSTLYDIRPVDLSYGEMPYPSPTSTTFPVRAIVQGGAICIVDPQSVAGQQLYKDFGFDLSDTTVYPRATDDASTPWDESLELNTAGRLAAFQKQFFYVLGVGVNSKMVGDRLAGLQEAPSSSVVSQGFYNKYAIVIKKGAGSSSSADRNAAIAGVLDPKGRGVTAARQAVSAIR